MIRHLTSVQYDRRDRDGEACVLRWRQWKREHEEAADGAISHRSSMHADELGTRMRYDETGRRVAERITKPRYERELQDSITAEAEALLQLCEKVTELVLVKVGYAPGSPSVDIWYLDGERLVHRAIADESLHGAAHEFAERVAVRLADADQPVTVWPRCTEP